MSEKNWKGGERDKFSRAKKCEITIWEVKGVKKINLGGGVKEKILPDGQFNFFWGGKVKVFVLKVG